MSVSSVAGLGFLSLFAPMAVAYQALAIRHVRRFHRAPVPAVSFQPPVSLLKPLCGDEPRLYECLRSFCTQDYPAFQLVFGVRSANDPAVATVRRLQAEFPALDLTLVTDAREHGVNPKVSNLINMMAACRHDVLVVADADVEVGRHALAAVVAPLADPTVGAVTCPYQGVPVNGIAARLGALHISDYFLPATVVDEALGGVDGLFGPLSALRRSALAAIGGFAAVRDHLAEDNRLGRLIARTGWRVVLSRHTVDTMVGETSLAALLRHEIRWARTGRSCRGAAHLMLPITFPLPFLLGLLALQPSWAAGGAVLLIGLLRLVLHYSLRQRFRMRFPASPWLLPLRETLSCAVWLASLVDGPVRWRDHEYRLLKNGQLRPLPCPARGGSVSRRVDAVRSIGF